MDPALRELRRAEPGDRLVEAIIRFRRPAVELPEVRVVARFATVATCRVRLSSVDQVRAHPDVVSLKAARLLGPEPVDDDPPHDADGADLPRRPAGLRLDGAGVVVGVVDWGLDFDHPNFKYPSGSTRLIKLWDQRSPYHVGTPAPRPYGYGTAHTRDRIDQALRTAHPYRTLGYHPADADRGGGAHGTHVMDIAAGSGTAGPAGVAPGADLVFVHLADRGTDGLANMGDSVRLLEAVHFIKCAAGRRPWVINLSMGRHGGPHDDTLPVVLALDELVAAAPGQFVVQSAGNYYRARTHATGVVGPGERTTLRFVTDPADTTPNELEIWYDGTDRFAVRIDPPGSTGAPTVELGAAADIVVAGRVAGRIYHRPHDPNNGDHHVDAFLYPWAPTGEWRVTIEGQRVKNGRFHAWIERDEACPSCQARFVPDDASPAFSLGTIATGRLPLVVSAYEARSPARPPGRSSSAGPTRDDRGKPDLAAPGVGVFAARSAPRDSERSPGLLVRKTGTSMAAPQVAGAVALCLSYAGHRLGAEEIRRLVLSTADPPAAAQASGNRLGHGYLNISVLLTALREQYPIKPEVAAMDSDHVAPLALAPARAYRELLYRPGGVFAALLDGRFTIVARPGQSVPEPFQVGDVILRVVLGRPGARGRCTVVAEPGLTHRRHNRPGEPAGWYAVAAAPGSDFGSRAVRVLDPAGFVLPGQLVLRIRPPETVIPEETAYDCGCGEHGSPNWSSEDGDASDPGPWRETAEQLDFRARVLAKHLARSRKAKGEPQRDLGDKELGDVPGEWQTERVQTGTATAEAAGRLLGAANAALAVAQKSGDADAQRTMRLRAVSGYRGSDHQRTLWLRYFAEKYYNRTRAARANIPDGPHSEAAVDHLLRPTRASGYGIGGRIAAPGYSNHQGGIALDLSQDRTKDHKITNDSDAPSRCRWQYSWFHGWLRTHAASFGFHPIPTEEWHWEYRPNVVSKSDLVDYRGGKLWTFVSATLPQPVAVFCPKAAVGGREVDVLLFAHGLLTGCTRPKRVPSGFVIDAPFELGRVVDESGRPVVLVVPLLDWGTPCGEVFFGRGHERWHPLGKPAVLNALVSEALAEAGRVQGSATPSLRTLDVAGHSRAYDMLEPLAASRADPHMRRGALAQLGHVWAFDTTYGGDVPAWTDWLTLNPALRVHVYYRPGTKTGTVGDRFYRARGDRLDVTKVDETHCAVPMTRLTDLMPRATAKPGEEESDEVIDPDVSAFLGLGDAEDTEGEELSSETSESC